MADIIEVEFDKIVYEGKALGRKDGKVVFSYGVLPGEKAVIKKVIEKKNYIEGEVVEVILSSPYRIKPHEEHYLSCSPWQIIKYEKQVEYKRKITLEGLYQSMKESVEITDFYPAQNIWAYRTKMEYSFFTGGEKISIAFHKRGDYATKIPLNNGCMLINEKANSVVFDVINQLNSSVRDPSVLKSIVVRYSFYDQSVITALFIKDLSFSPEINLFKSFHRGHINVFSKPQSSVSSVDGIISSNGFSVLREEILGKFFSYSFDSFFQNNIALFSEAVKIIKEETKGFKKIVDLYSGVGVIGICVYEEGCSLFLVESSKVSSEFARVNVSDNIGYNKDVNIINLPSEEVDEDILKSACVILDPPRAGLHKKLIKKIMKTLPPKIIYLSCNPITQGRDLVYLLEKYKLIKFYGFDFYPNTPHVESLAILERR